MSAPQTPFEPGSEEVQPDHVEDEVPHARVEEHVREDGPGPERNEGRHKTEDALHLRGSHAQGEEHRHVGKDQSHYPRSHRQEGYFPTGGYARGAAGLTLPPGL